MRNKVYWGLGVLIVLLIGAFVLVMVNEYAENDQLESDAKKAQEQADRINQQKNLMDNPPPDDSVSIFNPTELDATVISNVSERSVKSVKGPPLNIDWKNITVYLDWTDPRTLESYRNFWGFDPPRVTGERFNPVEDNWGYRFKHYWNTSAITYFNKRQGFRPSVEELSRYKQLQAELESLSGGSDLLQGIRAEIRAEIRELVANAQGELPNFAGSRGWYHGDEKLDRETRKRLQDEADRNVYRRMGIEHLYEFYEVDY